MDRGGETKTAILDAAEALFAEAGYDGVSTRDIARRARATLGLIGYHFGTKEALFEAVIARRAEALCARRRAALAGLSSKGGAGLEDVLDAFARPHFELMVGGEPGWRNYGRLIAYAVQADRWTGLIARHFDATARLFVDALAAAVPGLSRASALRGFVCVVALVVSAFNVNRRVDLLSGGSLSGKDLRAAYPSTLAFLAGGFRQLSAETARRRQPPARARSRRSH